MNIGKFIYSKKKYNEYRQEKYLGGLISVDRDYIEHKTIVKFYDNVILKSQYIDHYRDITINSKINFKRKRNIPIFNKILNKISSDYDDIYICKHHIGEIYIFCQLLNRYIKNNGSKKPLLVIPEERYISLYGIFCPNIDKKYINLNLRKMDIQVVNNETLYKGHRFFVPIPDRFAELRHLIFEEKQNVHFYDYIKRSMKIQDNEEFKPACISDFTKQKVINRAKEIGLNLDKFVIFSTEAVTAMDLSHTFWIKLGEYFSSKGYQIYVNTYTKSEQFKQNNTMVKENWLDKIPNSIQDFARFDEIYYLAQLSKGVIALVNGLVVTFAQIDTPRFFFYTNQTPTTGSRMDADTMLKSYRLDYLPGAYKETLHEINLNEICEKDLLKFIIDAFDKMQEGQLNNVTE